MHGQLQTCGYSRMAPQRGGGSSQRRNLCRAAGRPSIQAPAPQRARAPALYPTSFAPWIRVLHTACCAGGGGAGARRAAEPRTRRPGPPSGTGARQRRDRRRTFAFLLRLEFRTYPPPQRAWAGPGRLRVLLALARRPAGARLRMRAGGRAGSVRARDAAALCTCGPDAAPARARPARLRNVACAVPACGPVSRVARRVRGTNTHPSARSCACKRTHIGAQVFQDLMKIYKCAD